MTRSTQAEPAESDHRPAIQSIIKNVLAYHIAGLWAQGKVKDVVVGGDPRFKGFFSFALAPVRLSVQW